MRVLILTAVALACLGSAAASESAWFEQGKVRCLAYLDPSPQAESCVARVQAMGFNCALVPAGPLLRGKAEAYTGLLSAADRAGLRLIFVDNFQSKAYLDAHPDEPDRRFHGGDGKVSDHVACPSDPRYWQAVWQEPALRLAGLQAKGHHSAAGLLLDSEDYANLGDGTAGSEYPCLCDRCFGGFLRAQGKGAQVPVAEREQWLAERSWWQVYQAFQDETVVAIFRGIRDRLDQVAPDFVLATYPWPNTTPGRVAWGVRFAQGLGTARAPFLILDEATYDWGYDPDFEVRQAALAAQAQHFLAVAGFNVIPAARLWWPEEMAAHAYQACRRAGGYWLFRGDLPLLQAAGGQPLPAVFGDRPAPWIKEFTALNLAVAQGRDYPTAPLALPAITEWHYDIAALESPAGPPGREVVVRRWTEIGLPWAGGELVMIGRERGDWLSFTRGIGDSDRYELAMWLSRGPQRPIVQLEVDGRPVGEPVDLYQPVGIPGVRTVLGYLDLTEGAHTFTLRAVGKHPQATGYEIGLRAFAPEEVGYFPTEWQVIGTWDNSDPDHSGYDTAFPPERKIDLQAEYPGKDGHPVRWRRVAANPDGYLDLIPCFSDRKDVIAYCLTYVWSPREGARTVMLGSDDGGKLFVNGQWVWGEDAPRSAERDQNLPRAHFRRGWNEVLFKITQTTGNWGLYLRVSDPQRELRYAPAIPPGG